MMLLFSLATKKHKLTFKKLSECMDYLPIAAKWAEDEWGYIRNKGVEYREEVLRSISDNVYIGIYADQPVAMFALLKHQFHDDLSNSIENLPNAQELMYVYVDKQFRGLGFGKQVIDEAKQLAAKLGAEVIFLDTLKPSLNRMYEKHGAIAVCEGRLYSQPTEVLRM